MSTPFVQNFLKGMNIDLDETQVPQDMAVFIKDMTYNLNVNTSTGALAGSNAGVWTPQEGNIEMSISLPSGTNRCCGFYSSDQTNEGYVFQWNSAGNHTIWVINGNTGTVTLVFRDNLASGGVLLPFSSDPTKFISQGRCTLEIKSIIDPVTQNETLYKFLIFLNGQIRQYFIEVNSSIATSSFTTSFFTPVTASPYNRVELIHLGVPLPNTPAISASNTNDIITFAPVASDSTSLMQQNLLIRNGWQFRIKTVDIFGRESEHGIISAPYITIVGGGCISESNGMPRCVDITFDAGNPLVAQYQIEFRKWIGNDNLQNFQSNWDVYDIINKYTGANAEWYNRTINSAINYNSTYNTSTYRFCADKATIPIDTSETTRTQSGIPITSETVAPITERLALGNNTYGFQPIDPVQIGKVTYAPVLPSSTPCDAPPLRTVIFYANIYDARNLIDSRIRHEYGVATFGNDDFTFGQYVDAVFGDQDNPGFIAYMAGMSGSQYTAISAQGNLVIGGSSSTFTGDGSFTVAGIDAGSGSFPNTYMQQFKFSLPAGKYVARIASHKSKITDADIQSTSTYVGGIVPMQSRFVTGGRYTNMVENPLKEIEIDCTSGDVTLNGFSGIYGAPGTDPMFLILDPTPFGNTVAGYIYEDNLGGSPVEMTPILLGATSVLGTSIDGYGSFFTDHNGFYFQFGMTSINTATAGWDACDGVGFQTKQITSYYGNIGITYGDGLGAASTGSADTVHGNWKNQIYLYTGTKYPVCGQRKITQNISLCSDHSAGVPGIPVIMTKGATRQTDDSGNAVIIAHSRYDYISVFSALPLPYLSGSIPNYAAPPNNQDYFIFSQKGGCNWYSCSGCVPSTSDVVITYIVCCDCVATQNCRDTTLNPVYVTVSGINISGVQSGSQYPIGFILHDEIGRHTFVQVAQGSAQFVTIPNLNDPSYRKFELSSIGVTIASGTVFPSIFKKMTFGVAPNKIFNDYISSAADWVQLVDTTGNTNTSNPTSIRIYYGSINEYNKQSNFSTNSSWQFITTGQNNISAPVEGDVCQFIMNGDGTWLDSLISLPVTYDSSGLFFTIDFDNSLAALTNGALFRIIRPTVNQPLEFVYYETSDVIELIDGAPQTLSLTLSYFDSYMLARQLPVPIMAGITTPATATVSEIIGAQPGATPPGAPPVYPLIYTSSGDQTAVKNYATNNNNNANGVIIMSLNDAQTSYPFYFESPSPSDFWGSHLAARGRVFTTNPYEARVRVGTEIALSDTLTERSNLNGLSYFESQNSQTFDNQAWGPITAIFCEVSTCLVICNSQHFILRSNQTQLRVDNDGNVISVNAYGIFSAPEIKAGSNWGCSLSNINTIISALGTVRWLAQKGVIVSNDFSESKADLDNGCVAYIANKLSHINIANQNPGANGSTYLIGGYDPKTREYHLSSINIPISGSPSFINTQSNINISVNETLRFDMISGISKGFSSYTPEYYGWMKDYYLQEQFLSFKQGIPYSHHQGANATGMLFANFFGVQNLPRVIFVVNPIIEAVKRFFYIEVYTKENIPGASGQFPTALFYADMINTEKGQVSRLLPPRWDIRDGYNCAAFLCDLNTPADPNLPTQTGANVLLDGNPLIGRWLSVSLVTQSSYSGFPFKLSSTVTYVNEVQKSGGGK